MEVKTLEEYEGPPRTTGPSPNSGVLASCRSHSSGVWIWFLQRVAAGGTLILLVLHLHAPNSRRIQFVLLGTLLVHGAAGARILLIEYGKVSAKYHAALFWALLGIGAVLLIMVYLGIL